MRWGDYILCASFALNVSASLAYLAQGHVRQAVYFLGAVLITGSLLTWR